MGKYSDMAKEAAAPAPAGKYSQMLTESTPTKPENPGDVGSFGENIAAGLGRVALGVKQSVLDKPAQWIADHFPGLDELGKSLGMPTAAQGAQQTQQLIDQGKPFDNKLLWHSAGGAIGNLAGNALEAYALGRMMKGVPGGPSVGNKLAAMAPKAAPYVGAGAVGGGVGALQPTGSNESSLGDIIGGVIGGVGGQALGNLATTGIKAAKDYLAPKVSQSVASGLVDKILADLGKTRASFGADAASAFDKEVADALNTGGTLDQAALRRKMAFQSLGMQGTLGQITRDPMQFANEHLLTGLEGAGRPLADLEKSNFAGLVRNLNESGAAKSNMSFDKGGDYAAGNAIHAPLSAMLDKAKAHVSDLYKAAEDMNGRPIEMDHVAFTQRAGDLVDKTGKNYFLPDEFKRILNDVSTGKYPLTVGTAEQIKTALSSATRSAKDGNVRSALSAVRQALEETPIMGERAAEKGALSLPGQAGPSSVGQDAINAYRAARAANKQMMDTVESNPAIKDIFSGMEPDKFFQKHLVGNTSNVAEVQRLADMLKQNPQSFEQVKSDIVGWLKNKALNGASDEVGKFSQSGFNKAMSQIGRNKLAAFFSPEEIAKLQTIGRVASYMQVAPAGSRINTSNTAAGVANLAGKVAGNNALIGLAKKAANSIMDYSRVNTAVGAKVPVTNIPTTQNPKLNRLLQYMGASYGASPQ